MEKTLLLGKCDTDLLQFLKKEFNCNQLEIEENINFRIDNLEDYILDNKIENIFISDSKSYKEIFYDKGFIDSPIFSVIKNIFLIPENNYNLKKFSSLLPYNFIENSLNLEYKEKIMHGGILYKKNNTRDILYKFFPKFTFNIEEELVLFKMNKIEEGKLYIDFTYLNNYYSLLSKLEIESMLPINSKRKGEIILFSNLKLKSNREFYKNIITREINR